MTVTLHTPTKKRQKYRQIVTKPGIPMKSTGHATDGYCVAAFDLAQVLNEEIEKIDRELSDQNGNGAEGGIYALVARAAARTPKVNPDALVRRLYSIRARIPETRAMGAEMAERFLLSRDIRINTVDTIANLPGGLPAALDAVDAHWEFNETEPLDEMTRQRLAKMLLGFTRGYLAGVNADITTDTEEWARYVSGFRLDSWNRSYEGKLNPALRRKEDDAAA